MAATKTFGDLKLRMEPMLASEAITLYADLMRVASSATGRLPQIIAALSSDDTDVMADIAAMAAIGDMLRSTKSDEITSIIRRLVSVCRVCAADDRYDDVDLDGVFTDRFDQIIPVCRWVIKEQYGDFFTASVGGGIIRQITGALRNGK